MAEPAAPPTMRILHNPLLHDIDFLSTDQVARANDVQALVFEQSLADIESHYLHFQLNGLDWYLDHTRSHKKLKPTSADYKHLEAIPTENTDTTEDGSPGVESSGAAVVVHPFDESGYPTNEGHVLVNIGYLSVFKGDARPEPSNFLLTYNIKTRAWWLLFDFKPEFDSPNDEKDSKSKPIRPFQRFAAVPAPLTEVYPTFISFSSLKFFEEQGVTKAVLGDECGEYGFVVDTPRCDPITKRIL